RRSGQRRSSQRRTSLYNLFSFCPRRRSSQRRSGQRRTSQRRTSFDSWRAGSLGGGGRKTALRVVRCRLECGQTSGSAESGTDEGGL
ncbi:MAG: hypothetical protein ACK56F_23195, partial [bacterium]